jgi:regulatory protein
VPRYVNQPIPGSPADLQAEADPEHAARTIVLRRLDVAPRSRSELRADLLRRGIPEEAADRVLNRFAEVGLIDDEAYALAWVESRQRTRGTARSVLRQELRGKGIDEEFAAAALESIDDEKERDRAVRLAEAKARSMTRLEPEVRTRRLMSMLMRRGYRQATALSVVREVLGESGDDDRGLPEQG